MGVSMGDVQWGSDKYLMGLEWAAYFELGSEWARYCEWGSAWAIPGIIKWGSEWAAYFEWGSE